MAATLVSIRIAIEREEERREAEFQAYVANIAAASSAIRAGDVGEARQRLEETPPGLRNWEWDHLRSRVDQSVRVLDRHHLYAGAVSMDGSLVAASTYRKLRVWDVATSEVRFTVNPVDGPLALAFSPDGARLATGDGALEVPGVIRLWESGQ